MKPPILRRVPVMMRNGELAIEDGAQLDFDKRYLIAGDDSEPRTGMFRWERIDCVEWDCSHDTSRYGGIITEAGEHVFLRFMVGSDIPDEHIVDMQTENVTDIDAPDGPVDGIWEVVEE